MKGVVMTGKVLVLYDLENIKSPSSSANSTGKKVKFSLQDLKREIDLKFSFLSSTHIVFGKKHNMKTDKGKKETAFFSRLAHRGFKLVLEQSSFKKVNGIYDGKKYVHEFEKCDLDIKIIEAIYDNAPYVDSIVLCSGDSDMLHALSMAKNVGCSIYAIAHKESLSKKFYGVHTYELDKVLKGEWN